MGTSAPGTDPELTEVRAHALILDTYEAEYKLGEGAFGEVWAGRHVRTGERVALKHLRAIRASDDEVIARFRREAYFLSRVHSEYCAKIVDFVTDQHLGMLLVMELIEGDPLSRVLEDMTLTVEQCIELARDLLHGLRDLHAARIIHRDLKPANVILRPLAPDRCRAVIVDFSLSRIVAERLHSDRGMPREPSLTDLTQPNHSVGTLEYMAPEQLLNARQVTPASDLYSLGAILFRAASGKAPFGTKAHVLAKAKLSTEAPELPTGRLDPLALGFRDLVAKALRRRPRERYADAQEMLDNVVRLYTKHPWSSSSSSGDTLRHVLKHSSQTVVAAPPFGTKGPESDPRPATADSDSHDRAPTRRWEGRQAARPRHRGRWILAAAVLYSLGLGTGSLIARQRPLAPSGPAPAESHQPPPAPPEVRETASVAALPPAVPSAEPQPTAADIPDSAPPPRATAAKASTRRATARPRDPEDDNPY